MISNNLAKSILNLITGMGTATYVKGTSSTYQTAPLKKPTHVYIGMCALEPDKITGSLVDKGEPDGETSGYERKLISGCGTAPTNLTTGGTASSTQVINQQDYFINELDPNGAEKPGIITNNKEIQFSTARASYGNTMKYWFLSDRIDGEAFLWGQIKDILYPQTTDNVIVKTIDCGSQDKNSYSGTDLADLTNRYCYKDESSLTDPFEMKVGTQYIVTWGTYDSETEKWYTEDYTVTPRIYTDRTGKTPVQYIHLGNAFGDNTTKEVDDNSPFFIRYRIKRLDDKDISSEGVIIQSQNIGVLEVYSYDSKDQLTSTTDRSHIFGLYGEGINVPVATVPTFYKGQLRASIDIEL